MHSEGVCRLTEADAYTMLVLLLTTILCSLSHTAMQTVLLGGAHDNERQTVHMWAVFRHSRYHGNCTTQTH